MSEEWSWQDTESVVVEAVQAIAVYTNGAGNIVIRQQEGMGGDDSFVVLPRSAVAAIVKAIRREAATPFKKDD